MSKSSDRTFCEAAYELGLLSFQQIMDLVFRPQAAHIESMLQSCFEQQWLTATQIDAIDQYAKAQTKNLEIASPEIDSRRNGPNPEYGLAGFFLGKSRAEPTTKLNDDAVTVPWQLREDSRLGIERTETAKFIIHEQIGRYLAQEELGCGGMGIVYCVEDAAMKRRIALKELLPDLTANGAMSEHLLLDLRRRFVREAELTATLQHPGIVPVYEIGRRQTTGEAYYTMKKIEGWTLKEAISNAAGLEERLALLPNFIDVCQTLAYAHRQGVVHRDLKPTNIIIGEFGETYVLDWGLALFIDSSPTQRDDAPKMPSYSRSEASGSLTEKGVGTPHYMSPEQALGSTEEIDERSDIYSLGAVLFEILTGQKNTFDYNFGTLEALVSEKEENSPATNLALSLPAELVAICKRAMAPDKSHRFQDARDLAVAIQKVQTGAEIVLEQLAEAVHIAYMKERKAQGWRHGPVRDDARKENPTLIPYNELSEEEKDLDRVTARQTIQALRQLGFIVARERRPFPI